MAGQHRADEAFKAAFRRCRSSCLGLLGHSVPRASSGTSILRAADIGASHPGLVESPSGLIDLVR